MKTKIFNKIAESRLDTHPRIKINRENKHKKNLWPNPRVRRKAKLKARLKKVERRSNKVKAL